MKYILAAGLTGAAIVAAVAGVAPAVGAAVQGGATPARPAAYAKCAACHSVVRGGPNGVGPNLFGVVGRRAASAPKYNYSPALAKAKPTWNRQTLDRYIADPDSVARGGKMPKIGTSPADRAAIITYLSGLK